MNQKLFKAINDFREALKGSGFQLHDFGGNVAVLPIPHGDGWSPNSMIVIELEEQKPTVQ